MVRFVYARENADAEEILENINKYVLLGINGFELERLESYKEDLMNEMDIGLQRANTNWYISVYRPIVASNKIKEFIKRLIRKLVSWLMIDIANQQMKFNRTVVDYINHENDLMQILLKENEELKKKLGEEKVEVPHAN